jgi:hypothetical protein
MGINSKVEEVKKALDLLKECGEALQKAKDDSRRCSAEETRCMNELNNARKNYDVLIKECMAQIDPRHAYEGRTEPVPVGVR